MSSTHIASTKKLMLLELNEYALHTIYEELKSSIASRSLGTILEPVLGNANDDQLINKLFQKKDIHTVYHTAAYKHVALTQTNICQCISNNLGATRVLSKASHKFGVDNFIHISTDKAVNPTNVMGVSKRICELLIRKTSLESHTNFSVVRFGNVLNSSGSVIPIFLKQIEQGGPVTVTHPSATRYFMTIPEAAQLVIQAGALEICEGVIVLDMGEPQNIFEMAKKLIHNAGFEPVVLQDEDSAPTSGRQIEITFTGLKSGEKMHEELLHENEVIESLHPKIAIANNEPTMSSEKYSKLKELERAAKNMEAARCLAILGQLGFDIKIN